MYADFVNEMYRQLLAERAKLLKELQRNRELCMELKNAEPARDSAEAAAQNMQAHLALANGDHINEKLKLVDEALNRLERKQFGDCSQCGEEIPTNRLLVIPWAQDCCACAKRREEETAAREKAEATVCAAPSFVFSR